MPEKKIRVTSLFLSVRAGSPIYAFVSVSATTERSLFGNLIASQFIFPFTEEGWTETGKDESLTLNISPASGIEISGGLTFILV